jgi:hypothetical protein
MSFLTLHALAPYKFATGWGSHPAADSCRRCEDAIDPPPPVCRTQQIVSLQAGFRIWGFSNNLNGVNNVAGQLWRGILGGREHIDGVMPGENGLKPR